MRDFILREMKRLNADGVEFISLFANFLKPYKMFADMTFKQVKETETFLKTNRRYYKLVNGKKEYIEYTEEEN